MKSILFLVKKLDSYTKTIIISSFFFTFVSIIHKINRKKVERLED